MCANVVEGKGRDQELFVGVAQAQESRMIMGKDKRVVSGCEIVVCPAGTGRETRLVLGVAVLVIILCALAIGLRNSSSTAKVVPSWQVDAFKDLRAEELATFNALYTAAPEIDNIHGDEDGHWPTVFELESSYISPFVQDSAWKKSGRLGWTRSVISTEESHVAFYLGNPLDPDISGSFLLVMMHKHVKKQGNARGATHAPYEIWFHPSSIAKFSKIVTDQTLIGKGWREVIAFKGEDEMKRTKGEEYTKK